MVSLGLRFGVYSCFYLIVVGFGVLVVSGLGLCWFGFWMGFPVGLYKSEIVVVCVLRISFRRGLFCWIWGFVFCCLFWAFALGGLDCCLRILCCFVVCIW